MTNMETDLPYLSRDLDRHGNPRIYVRRNGKRIRINEAEGTPAFAKAYADAVEKLDGQARRASKPADPCRGHAGLARRPILRLEGEANFSRSTRNRSAHAATASKPASGAVERRRRRADGELPAEIPLGAEDQAPDRGGRRPRRRTNRRKHLSALCAWGVETSTFRVTLCATSRLAGP